MATIKCEASGCKNTEKSGKIFYQCNHCGRWWCSSHGYANKKCPACQNGFLKR